MKDWWLSLYIEVERYPAFEYHGPWWVSGETADGKSMTVVAAVRAGTEEVAKERIRLAFDEAQRPPSIEGEHIVWRFCEDRTGQEGFPFLSDRFPKRDWMNWPQPESPVLKER